MTTAAPSKQEYRKLLRKRLKAIPQARRKYASIQAAEALMDRSRPYSFVASFFPLLDELDLRPVNELLRKEGKLLLPRIQGDQLEFYHVTENRYIQHPWGIWEPDPLYCVKIDLFRIDMMLVPGLGFGPQNARLGYGKGFYDRILALFSGISIGVGFCEQWIAPLPRDERDLSTSHSVLF